MTVNILFVDDEPFILQSLKRTFRSNQIETFLADSAKMGLEILGNNRIDIVVSDVRMPEMDGIEFLKIVRHKFPHVYRLILSGYVDREVVLQAILSGVAFEYLTKPWEKDMLRSKLNHIVDIKALLTNERIVNLINGISHLPKDISRLKEIENAIEGDESFELIASLISEDLSMATKLLQVVNSTVFSTRKISSVRQAITALGLSNVKSLLFTSSFISNEDELSEWQKNEIEALVIEQLNVNTLFSKLYEKKYRKKVPDECASIGLTYNIGKIIITSYFQERHLETLKKCKDEGIGYYDAELELGYAGETHQEIGAYFLELWNFSRVNIEASLFHHNVKKASAEYRHVLNLLDEAANTRKLRISN